MNLILAQLFYIISFLLTIWFFINYILVDIITGQVILCVSRHYPIQLNKRRIRL